MLSREAPNRRGRRIRPRTAPRRGRRGSLNFFIYALRARGRKRGQCRPRRRGRHLHGSPVRAQKPADGESESFRNLKATNYKKEPDQGQTNTGHPNLGSLLYTHQGNYFVRRYLGGSRSDPAENIMAFPLRRNSNYGDKAKTSSALFLGSL